MEGRVYGQEFIVGPVQHETPAGHSSGEAGQAFLCLSSPPMTHVMSGPWWLMLFLPLSSSLSLGSTIKYPYKVVGCFLCPPSSLRVFLLLHYPCNVAPESPEVHPSHRGLGGERETPLPSVLVSAVTNVSSLQGL